LIDSKKGDVMPPLLELDKITKNYGQFKAIKELSFSVNEGEILGFLGLNGSGKTTTIKILAGLLPDYDGRIIYKGKTERSIGNKPEITFIFDSQNFYDNLTAYENLRIISYLNLSKFKKRSIKKDITYALEQIGLKDWIYKPVKTFSRGMKQRLSLASALLLHPDFLILDEPTNGLDIDGIYLVEQYFSTLSKSGCTILLSSHYLEEVERLANHIIIIHKGEKKFDGSNESLAIMKLLGVTITFNEILDNNKKETIERLILETSIPITKIDFYENKLEVNFNTQDYIDKVNDLSNYIEKINNLLFENKFKISFIEPIYKHLKELFFIEK